MCGVPYVGGKTAENKTDHLPPSNYELNIPLTRMYTILHSLMLWSVHTEGIFCIVFLCVGLEVMSMFLKHFASKSFCFCGEEDDGLEELDLSHIAYRRC